MWAVLGQPDSIGVEDEDAVIAERDFLGLPRGFVAVVGGPTGVPGPGYSDKVVVVSRNPLFDGLPGLLDERNRGTDTLCRLTLCADLIQPGRSPTSCAAKYGKACGRANIRIKVEMCC